MRTIWLRLGLEDRDPASLLLSLINAAQTVEPICGEATLDKMRQQPGPVYGWPPLYSNLARELYETLPQPTVLVVEHLHMLGKATETLDLLWDHFLPLLPAGMVRILTRYSSVQKTRVPPYVNLLSLKDLRLDHTSSLSLAHKYQLPLPDSIMRWLINLSEGRTVLLSSLLEACRQMGVNQVARIAQSAGNRQDQLTLVARALLDDSMPGSGDLLSLAMQIDYLNPNLTQMILGHPLELPGEFLLPLTNDWSYLQNVWRGPLGTALQRANQVDSDKPTAELTPRITLERAVEYLTRQGFYDQAIPLLLSMGNHHEAARAILQVAETMLDRGQWQTLSGWLEKLPEPIRQEWPWLVYFEGELTAGQGQPTQARKIFAGATRLFFDQRDMKGTCQSLLTESCLAAWKEDIPKARELAHRAQSIAESHKLVWHQGWAGWQLGVLAISSDNIDEALIHFNNAAEAAAEGVDKQLIEFTSKARQMTQAQVTLLKQMEHHRQAMDHARNEEHEIAARLHYLLESPAEHTDQLLTAHGWSRMPLMAKLPVPARKQTDRLGNLLRSLLEKVPTSKDTPSARTPASFEQLRGLSNSAAGSADLRDSPHNVNLAPLLPQTGSPTDNTLLLQNAGETLQQPEFSHELPATAAGRGISDIGLTGLPIGGSTPITLNAYLLGNFRLLVNDQSIENLLVGRSRSIFVYLLAQARKPIPRDMIMEIFWPESEPDAARNNLNVAIHGLRKALKSIVSVPIVIFNEDAYHINPKLIIWLDAVEFERHVKTGQHLEAKGQISQAICEFEAALSLYQGDLLSDSPYEDWPAIERERLRVRYLETLDRLSLDYFNAGQYAACINLCLFLLARDSGREDAHCRLMRSYCRQGQHHMALRQYQACVETLREELDVEPSLATKQLYEKIRRRDLV